MSDHPIVPPTEPALDPALQAKAQDLAKTINIDDSSAVVQYGIGAQTKIAGFADTMLASVRSKDAGDAGDVLSSLLVTVKTVDVNELTGGKKNFFGMVVNTVEKFFARYQKLEGQIDRIVDQLNASRMAMLKDVAMLDQLYAKNLEYLADLDLYISAGKIKLQELNTTTLPAMEAAAKASTDAMVAQKYNDFMNFVHRFEKKIDDLARTRIIAIQTAPSIRMIQNNDQALVEKIQTSIIMTIPIWKEQLVLAVTMQRGKKTADLATSVDDATNQMLLKNSEALKQGTLEVAKATERSVVEVETLQTTNANLISTLEETLRIHEEGRTKRAAAEQELVKIESDLKTKLTEIKQS